MDLLQAPYCLLQVVGRDLELVSDYLVEIVAEPMAGGGWIVQQPFDPWDETVPYLVDELYLVAQRQWYYDEPLSIVSGHSSNLM